MTISISKHFYFTYLLMVVLYRGFHVSLRSMNSYIHFGYFSSCLLYSRFSPISVSFVISLPFAIVFRTVVVDDVGHVYCQEVWPEPEAMYSKVSIIIVVFTTYIVPLSVIIFCYARILKTLWRNRMTSGVSNATVCILH